MSSTDVVRIAQQGPVAEEEQGRLKADLHFRRRGLLKSSSEISYQGRKCARCGAPFGRFYNTGTSCARCRQKICKQCRIEVGGSKENKEVEWICNVCYKIAGLHVATGNWIFDSVSGDCINEKTSSPVEILKHSIRRAWTINGAPTCWSATRKSPELRVYRSLPTRRQEYRETTDKSEPAKIGNKEILNSEVRQAITPRVDEVNNENYVPRKSDIHRDTTITNEEVSPEKSPSRIDINERTDAKRNDKSTNKSEEEVQFSDTTKQKKAGTGTNKIKAEDQEEPGSIQEQATPRLSLIKPPRILTKLISPEIKSTQLKHGERKSNIPIFRRSSKEFEDIRSPQESPKRSLIPQRYRGSTDDLRRSREDISVPSLIPKLLSPRNKDDRLKRQDSKDDVRPSLKSSRRDSKDESKGLISQSIKEDSKYGARIFRRDNSREDVGRDGGNFNANTGSIASKGKSTERQELAEERVGVSTTTKSKSTVIEQSRTKLPGTESKESLDNNCSRQSEETLQQENHESVGSQVESTETMFDVVIANENKIEEQEDVNKIDREENEEHTAIINEQKNSVGPEELENNANIDAMKETTESFLNTADADITIGGNDQKSQSDLSCGRKWDDFQVIRRKFSKEEFSNADDTDETPNKRCSSHLSPEASPLSTRSSRYSPRESESEPTPALPRKTSDSCSASQRIRDAITRTRRESNSSARYESSGSESVRLSETGLHGYVELARKVKFFGGIGSGAVPSTIGSDEVVQRDSATSAGEDEPRDDNHSRAGPISSQGRSMLRRRRQFDAQGSRRRGRSHARSCYAEELQGFQALHVIGRDDRQHSPTGNQGQDQPIVDYRRLVFISSDSSSGREEDDADSSCSSSSYLNGLPRSGSHAQSLEDCDWDYFESGSLPLPPGVPVAIGTGNLGTDSSVTQDWSCCPGRGSAACQACGGSRGANVLPVPVPIPVPVPYPVPVPAALWTGDFAAAASSMISRSTDQGEPGTLRLRGDPAAPWFAWHPRFNQPLHGARLDPRITDAFDPATCTFRTDQVLAARFYGSDVGTSPIPSAETYHRLNSLEVNRDEKDNAVTVLAAKLVESSHEKPKVDAANESKTKEHSDMKIREDLEETSMVRAEKSNEKDEKAKESDESQDAVCESTLTASMERRGQRMYQHSHEDSGSSSGRSSADSSDLEDDSPSHRFSRVFVVNDDSLSSDDDVEDNRNEEDSDSANEGGVTLKKVTALPEEEPVVLQYVRALNEDTNFDILREDRMDIRNDTCGSGKMASPAESSNPSEKRKSKDRNSGIESESSDRRVLHVLQCRAMSEEIYLAGDNDSSENPVTLKSIKTLDPDSFELPAVININENSRSKKENNVKESSLTQANTLKVTNQVIYNEHTNISLEQKSVSSDTWDSNIIPDSLEISSETVLNGDHTFESPDISGSDKLGASTFVTRGVGNVADCDIIPEDGHSETSTDKHGSLSQIVSEETFDRNDDNDECSIMSDLNSSVNVTVNMCAPPGTDSSTSTDTTTTGSEVSSDELHEYEVTPSNVSLYRDTSESVVSAVNSVTLFRLNKRNEENGSFTQDRNPNDILESMEIDNTPDQTRVTDSSTTRWDMQCERTSSEQSSDNSNDEGVVTARAKNDSGVIATEDDDELTGNLHGGTMIIDAKGVSEGKEHQENLSGMESNVAECNMGDMISCKVEEILKSAEHGVKVGSAHDADSCAVRGEIPYSRQVVGDFCGSGNDGGGATATAASTTAAVGGGSCIEEGLGGGATPFRLVERRPSTGKENGFPLVASTTDFSRDAQHFPSAANNNIGNSNSNKYRSLVMITQEASYQPVSVITSDTTTLLQPDEVHTAGQGLAGYFQLALEAVAEQPHRKSGQGPRKPLMVKRLTSATTNQSEPEVDSGLSVGSASESDDVSVKNVTKIPNRQENNEELVPKERQQVNEQRDGTRTRVSSQSSDDNSGSGGVVILEEGLADDDSWVEEVSHDEDEPGATTGTEESSEDEANNLGDREEELRGYHRQAIDFTLHTIVEESCEESEAEPSMATGSPSKKQRPPSASELEKYFFFGLGGEANNSSMGSREVDSLSETSSIYSEGLESLGQDESPCAGQNQDRSSNGEGFLNSSRLEKYFLSEFLGFDQDRRDSDGSVGSDSEGRPSPEAQRRKRLVRARGTGRSHSSSLDNLLALTQSSQNLSSQNSLQDLSLNQDAQESQSEGSSTETDGADDGQTVGFGTDGQFDTVKRKKKKPRNLGTQSPRVPDDRNKTPEPIREMSLVGEVVVENEAEIINSEDSERAKTPQPECVLSSTSSASATMNSSTISSAPIDSVRNLQIGTGDSLTYNQRTKQQSRDSGFVGSCDDLLQHQKSPDEVQGNPENTTDTGKDRSGNDNGEIAQISHTSTEEAIGTEKGCQPKTDHLPSHTTLPHLPNASLSRKDSFNNWSSDEETNLMMSKMRQFFKTMVANTNGQSQNVTITNSSTASPAPSPRLPGYSAKARLCAQNRTKPPQLVYFENELTRLMKTVPGIRDEQVREIVEYLSSEDTWSDSYDSSDYTSSDLEGAAGGRRSALQEQISQSCQQIISKFDTTSGDGMLDKDREDKSAATGIQAPCLGRDTAFVYQKLVQSFTKMTGDGVSSDANSTPHSSPPLIAKVMHHIGSRLVALMHEVSEGGPAVQHHSTSWRRYSQHHRTPSSASTTEDDESTSDSTNPPSSAHLQLPRSKSHDPLLLINNHPAASAGQEGEEREASDYERFSWRGSFESALMAADSRTKLSLLACSGDVSAGASASASALAMAAKRRSAGDLLFNPKSFSREQLDRVRSCGSIGGGSGGTSGCGGSIEERIWTNRRRSSVPDANTRRESGASAGDDDTEDELEYVTSESRATTLPRGMQSAMTAATNSLPRLPASAAPTGLTTTSAASSSTMHKAHSVYHFLPQHTGVKSARYRPPGFARNSNVSAGIGGPKRAVSAPGLQVSGSQSNTGKRDNSRSRRQQAMSLTPDDGNSLSEACSTPIIGAGSRSSSSHTIMDVDDMDPGLHPGHLATRASLSSLGARSDSMASVYSGAGEGRCCRSVVVTGEVEFALQYDYKHLTFEVHVTKCKNLAPVDVKRKRSDPYVKVYLLPDKSKSGKRKTKVKKHTLNPEFNETLKFHMTLSGLETRTLWLTVWHSDMFGRNDFLGEVRMPLENKIFDDPTPKWYPLQERTEPFDDPIAYKGEVIVGLKFVPPDPSQQQERELGSDYRGALKSRKNWSRGALHVLVKEARNLQTRAKNSGTCDPFCKSYLLPDKGRSGKQKTGVVRKSGGSPVWGHTFIYKDVSLQELAERGLELTVWDHDRIASNEFLGGVRFNLGTGKHYGKPVDWMDATGRELSLWQSMLERPNFWVEGAVTLRPNLHNHGKNNGS